MISIRTGTLVIDTPKIFLDHRVVILKYKTFAQVDAENLGMDEQKIKDLISSEVIKGK